jgi:hypothetical protein
MIKIFNKIIWKNNNFGYKWDKFCDKQRKRVYIESYSYYPESIPDKKKPNFIFWSIYNWFEMKFFVFLNGFGGHHWFIDNLRDILE